METDCTGKNTQEMIQSVTGGKCCWNVSSSLQTHQCISVKKTGQWIFQIFQKNIINGISVYQPSHVQLHKLNKQINTILFLMLQYQDLNASLEIFLNSKIHFYRSYMLKEMIGRYHVIQEYVCKLWRWEKISSNVFWCDTASVHGIS